MEPDYICSSSTLGKSFNLRQNDRMDGYTFNPMTQYWIHSRAEHKYIPPLNRPAVSLPHPMLDTLPGSTDSCIAEVGGNTSKIRHGGLMIQLRVLLTMWFDLESQRRCSILVSWSAFG